MKIALITGGGSGIGKEAALALYYAGYGLALAGRTAHKLEAVFQELGGDRELVLCVPTDVSNPESVHSLFAQVKEKWGRLDLLFNNAGVSLPSTPMEEVGYSDW